ncbi:Tc toxin subunit A [Pseudomonas sp. BIC9C]|uniref:Tc toxin subunit A n=1 Tax=Pseudomonas sp. BIC9C TaxID=3078458 RepID=UPI002AD58F82|nr:Tc toxin subunit A [Pseudomonas sp. BIC9C]
MDMTVENHSLLKELIKDDDGPQKKGRVNFKTAMQKLGFESVFDIVRLSQSEFASRLALFSDANAQVAYDNARSYATLLARLYREHSTSSDTPPPLAQRTGVRSLVPQGPTFQNLFKENWDDFCKVGALADSTGPVAYLSELYGFVKDLEKTQPADPQRILLDKRRPDLKDLLITQDSVFAPQPMLEIVNEVLSRNLRAYLGTSTSLHLVLSEKRYPFELPYNFYHHQCQLGLADEKPRLGALNYRASVLLPIAQGALGNNRYGKVQNPALQAQQLLTGLSPQQQALLIEPSLFSNFYLNRNDLINGWKSAGTTHLRPHTPLGVAFLLPTVDSVIGPADPVATEPTSAFAGTNVAPVTFSKQSRPNLSANLKLNSATPTRSNVWLLTHLHTGTEFTITSVLQADGTLPNPAETGYTARFNLHTATGTVAAPVLLAKQSVTLTLDEQYHLSAPEKAFFKRAYGVDIQDDKLSHLSDLNHFMQQTGLKTEQVEMLLSQHSYSVRLSPNCPSKNLQSAGVTLPGTTGKVLPFPHANHYGACYVNGTGTGGDLYDSLSPPSSESIIRDQFDNSMGLVQEEFGEAKFWRLTKLSLDRLDRLQRMVRLQRYTGLSFTDLDTLVISAIRAEGQNNLGMELNKNTLRTLGVYQHLNRRYGIAPQEFAALLHDLPPYASGKGAVALFDQVFNQVQMFDSPLILDQSVFNTAVPTSPADQKTLLQLCAGLNLQPTDDSLMLIVAQTRKLLGSLKRDLPTVSSLYRQARIARLFGCSVADLLTLAGLLGGSAYKGALASGRLSPQTDTPAPDILDILMHLEWATDWLKDSQQSVEQLRKRLGPNVPLVLGDELETDSTDLALEYPPLPDDMLARLNKLHDDTLLSCMTPNRVNALGLPALDQASRPLHWLNLLKGKGLLDEQGLLPGLDELKPIDEPLTWLRDPINSLVNDQNLAVHVKEDCKTKLTQALLEAHDQQTQLLEALFKDTADLAQELAVAVIHWANASVYSFLGDALETNNSALIEVFQRVSQHAEIVVQLRLSNSALRLFVLNPDWLGAAEYEETSSEPSLAELYLFERFSHWFHGQRHSEDALLSYFSLANPTKAKLKNKALRQIASETANAALARLLEWPVDEITALANTLPDKRVCTMAQLDWVRRCQATCQASGLSAGVLLKATALDDNTTPGALNAWKAVGEAIVAANQVSDSSLANV